MFKRIYFFFFTYMAAMYFSQTLLVFWLFKNGFTFSDIIIYYLICFISALIGIFLLSGIKMKVKPHILFGVLCSALSIAVLIKISNTYGMYQILFSGIITGLNVIFFWIPYNIMYFKFSREEKRGLNSGMYFLITPIIGITLQPLAGIVAEKFGFETMFLIGMLFYLIPIFLIRYLPQFEWGLNVKEELAGTKFNWTTFLQGFVSRINYSLIPIFTLFFITTPKAFGNFFGYLAILAAIASLINAYISDKMKSRKYFFYFFSTLAVISFLPLAFIDNIYYWSIFVGISSLCMYLATPFWLAFNLDYYKEQGVEKTMVLREIFLNLGYVISLLIVFFVYYFTSSTKISFIVTSVIICILPIMAYLQGVYRNRDA